MKTIFYKLYVIALLILVVWAAQFMYPLIFWEVQYTGVEKKLNLNKNDDDMLKMRKIRHYFDNETQIRKRDLGDVVVKEHFEKGHFHHPGQPLIEPPLNGCDYCHSIFAHYDDEEARAFRNMHGYFLACESCHYWEDINKRSVEYGWVKVKTEQKTEHPLEKINRTLADKTEFEKAKGNYGARIAPWISQSGKLVSVIGRSNRAEAQTLLASFDTLARSEVKRQLNKMHQGLTKKPLECDACHTRKKPALDYIKLGYQKKAASKLQDEAVAGLLSKYDKFHFPNLFIRKESRQRDREIDPGL